MTQRQFFAGIGAHKNVPHEIIGQATLISAALIGKGFGLRSGGAECMDEAFRRGAVGAGARSIDGNLQIFYPDARDSRKTPAWEAIAQLYHPNWAACDERARMLHARNTPIILGANVNDPVQAVVCWTADGGATGGTGQGMRIAYSYNIPVYNIYWPTHLAALWEWIGGL